MVGVRQEDRRAQFLQLSRGEGFDGRLCADRHENGREDFAVERRQARRPGSAIPRGNFEWESHVFIFPRRLSNR